MAKRVRTAETTITLLPLTLFTSIVHARMQASSVRLERSEAGQGLGSPAELLRRRTIAREPASAAIA